jgi:hypothetical protein
MLCAGGEGEGRREPRKWGGAELALSARTTFRYLRQGASSLQREHGLCFAALFFGHGAPVGYPGAGDLAVVGI